MRFLSLLTFATAVLAGVSALTVPVRRPDFDTEGVLEIREPGKNLVPNPIKFSPGAKLNMDNLGLAKGSAERKQVKEYHRQIVRQQMAINGAASAQVVHLAHITGSADPQLHLTAGFWDASDKRMKVPYGSPPVNAKMVHVYTDPATVDKTYLDHLAKSGKTL